MIETRPSIIGDLTAMQSHWPRKVFVRLVSQVQLSSPTLTVLKNGEVLAVAGIFPADPVDRLWFLTNPNLRGRREVRSVLLKLKRALSKVDGPIEFYVKPGHKTGFRLAAFLDFVPAGTLAGIGWLKFTKNVT